MITDRIKLPAKKRRGYLAKYKIRFEFTIMQYQDSKRILMNTTTNSQRSCIMVVTLIFLCSGCASELSRITSASLPSATVSYYARTLNEFDYAYFYKPARQSEETNEDIQFTLAPLIIEQTIRSAEPHSSQSGFGAIEINATGSISIDPEHPTVYTDISETLIDGESFDQLVYVWWYQIPRPPSGSYTLSLRGVRITMGKEGYPLICEVLDDDPIDLMYVSQTLEQAARLAYGPPLMGRYYSVEREYEEIPQSVVARLLEDGPVPMGPYVYLQADSKAVTTLSCRCMPSQMHHIVESRYYDLIPLETLGRWGLESMIRFTAYQDRLNLDQRLRWPAH